MVKLLEIPDRYGANPPAADKTAKGILALRPDSLLDGPGSWEEPHQPIRADERAANAVERIRRRRSENLQAAMADRGEYRGTRRMV